MNIDNARATPYTACMSSRISAQDMDQRSVGLAFTGSGPYTVTAPADANVAPPGLYMLFVLRPKSGSTSGQTAIPSVAKIVQVKNP